MLAGDSKKIKIIVAVGLIGIVLIFASDLLAGNEKKAKNDNEGSISYEEYTEELENKLVQLISSIDGVGECQVMVTLENTT